jgi:hypothetical protein
LHDFCITDEWISVQNRKEVEMKRFTLSLFFLLPFLLVCTSAMALTITVGEATESDSWLLNLTLYGNIYPNVTLETFIISDDGAGPFHNDGMTNFSEAGWSAQLINPNYSLANGPFNYPLDWQYDFAGDSTRTMKFDLIAWIGDPLIPDNLGGAWGINWSGQDGYLVHPEDLTGFNYDRSAAPVPEPATMLLLGTGLVGLAGIGRKKFFKKK